MTNAVFIRTAAALHYALGGNELRGGYQEKLTL